MKIEEMADVFLISANFPPHAFLTLVPPSGYALNLKALIKVSKLAEHFSFHMKYLDLCLTGKFQKLHFSEKSSPLCTATNYGISGCGVFKAGIQN